MTVTPTGILWLPGGGPESRSVFDYETGSFRGSGRTIAGIRVTEETALESTVVLACLRVLGESVASLPLHVYRRLPGGGKEIARGHPLSRLLHVAPNDWQTSFEWREQQMLHLGTYGQSFSEIVLSPSGLVRALVPLHPSRMTVERLETGRLRYQYLEEEGGFATYSQEQVMHVRWLSDDGVNGMVPVALARDAIALARACEVHGAAFFGNGARPGVVLATDNTLSAEAAESLRNNWERVHRGPDRAGRTAVLMGGLKPVELGINNHDSQYLETRRFQIEEICRLYRVPPHLVGDLTRSSFSNVEQQSLDFVQHTLLPWLKRFESAFARDLLLDDEHFIEFDTRGLLRGDAAGRAAYYQTLWNLGVASINEIRGWENLNPVVGGDTRFVQLNMQTLEAAAAKPEPPPVPVQPAADVGGLLTVLAQVKDGGLSAEAALATLGTVFPALPAAAAAAIVDGVNEPPEPPPAPEEPAADVSGLLAILAQVSEGGVTQDAALAIIRAVFPAMSDPLARAIVAGAKPKPEPPPETPEPPPETPGPPSEDPEPTVPVEAAAADARGFCPTGPGGGIDNSCGKGGRRAADVSPKSLAKHAKRVAGGSYIDGGITSAEFPDGAVVPRDVDRLRGHHARAKREIAERVGVEPVRNENLRNSAVTVRELHEDAKAIAPEFQRLVEEAAKAAGAEASFGHDAATGGTHVLKKLDSLEGKVPRIRREVNDPDMPESEIVTRELKDSVRGSIIANSPESLGDSVRFIQDYAARQGLEVGIKNRFLDNDRTGYGAVHMSLQMRSPEGRQLISELQFHLRAAYDGNQGSPKDNSHGLYKPDPKTNSVSESSAAAQMLIWSRAFEDVLSAPRPRRRGSRGYCPTGPGGGIDNSCGKGGGGTSTSKKSRRTPSRRPPKPPEPDWSSETTFGATDPRGAVTGHGRTQRLEHLGKVEKWLERRGIELAVKDDEIGPPSMHAMEAITAGITELERRGITTPRRILIEDLRGNAPAAYDYRSQDVIVDPDFSLPEIRTAVRHGHLAGVEGKEQGVALVHEMSHHDHYEAIKGEPGDSLGHIRNLMGRPAIFGPTTDPWSPQFRFGDASKRPNGRPTTVKDAVRIAGEVSGYARMNPLEFVAEVRSGATFGVRYSKEVLDLYADYKGPPLSGPSRTPRTSAGGKGGRNAPLRRPRVTSTTTTRAA